MTLLVPNRVGDLIEDHDMTRIHHLALIAAVLLLSACAAKKPLPPPVAKKEPASMITAVAEKGEKITATGYAVISVQNHRTPAQQRLMAIRASKLDAYRALTEQVYGQQIDANTTVAEMAIMNDTFRARVEGVVYGAVLVSITPVGDDTYETTLSLDRNVVNDLRALYLAHLSSRR